MRQLLIEDRVKLNGEIVRSGTVEVGEFCRVSVDDRVLQDREALYYMINKPAGYVSVRNDPVYHSALELVDIPNNAELHTAGRLDLDTTGLFIVTNDGAWSRRLTDPDSKKPKVYRVETSRPVSEACEALFAEGMRLLPEDIVTQPAKLERLGEREVRLIIYEGRYRQIKRMFWRFENKVVALHRERMGDIELDDRLEPGQFRSLTEDEIASV